MQWVTAQWKHLDTLALIVSQKERHGSASNFTGIRTEKPTPRLVEIKNRICGAEDRTLVSLNLPGK